MMLTANRLRTLVLLGLVLVAMLVLGGLTFTANAVKSELRSAENHIVALRTRQMMLETELETRGSQRQLAEWNAVDFGYQPPRASQFLESERQLAFLGAARAPGAPAPIRAAAWQEGAEDSALTGQAQEDTKAEQAFAASEQDTDNGAPSDSAYAPAARLAGTLGSGGRISLSAVSGIAE